MTTVFKKAPQTLERAVFSVFCLLSFSLSAAWGADLRVTLVNVGVGDAILIETPGGRNILVDGGNTGPGETLLIPYLQSRGIDRIHQMVATNRDADHTGGLNAILGDSSFSVDEVVYRDSGVPARLTNIGSRTLTQLAQTTAAPAPTLSWDSELTVEILNARDGEAKGNNDSIVLKITHGSLSWLLTGDIETPVVDDILTNFPSEFPVTFLKVPHHGSNSSISTKFPSETGARLALISGAKDQNNNPDPDVLDSYAAANIPILRTDQRGDITIVSNGASYSLETSLLPTDLRSATSGPDVHVYPNPAPGRNSPAKATIVYDINGRADDARVAVYSLSGGLVRSWTGASRNPGANFQEWDLKNGDGEDVASGLYIVQVETRSGRESAFGKAKMAVLRR